MIFSDHKNDIPNVYSQWGEDGIINKIFSEFITPGDRTCIEFGAADGLFCSNTARLWRDLGWKATLIESDPDLYHTLRKNVVGYEVVSAIHGTVTTIDEYAPNPVDLASIDIDGYEYSILYDMKVLHKVLVVEHNPTIPPHMSLRGSYGVGSSARSLIELAARKGYRFLCSTLTNLFLVHEEWFQPFEDAGYDFDLETNFDRSSLNYVVTDYTGGYDIKGLFPYGMSEHRPLEVSADIPDQNIEYIVRQGGFSEWALSRYPGFPLPHQTQGDEQ